MKAIALAYGGLLLVFFLGSLVIMDVIAKGDVKRDVVSREGKLISFVNEAEMLIRSFDQSIYFISQRAAYELAKNGGAYKGPKIFWTEDDPKIDFLERNLEDKIKDNLPSSDYTREERKITWGESVIDVCDYLLNPPCGPIELSECFLVDGSKYLVVYDKSIDSRISVNQDINSNVDSNYFRLLNAGRTIMEDPLFNQHLNDVGTLLNLLFIARGNGDPRFVNLDFIIDVKNETDEDIITVVITDYCYPPDIYCLAPLTPGDHAVTEELHNMGDINWDGVIDIEDNETCQAAMDSSMGSSNWNSVCDLNNDGTVGLADIGILNGNFGKENPAYIIVGGEKITYDHVRLIFKFKKEQTEFTPLSPGTLEVYAWVGVVEVNAIVAIGLGDVDWSGVVDDADLWFYDAANPNSCMNTIPGDVNWDIDCDMNLDNVIDGDDLNIVNLQKGKAIQIYTTDFTETLDVGAYTLRAKYLEMIQQKTAFIFPGLVTRVDFYFSECTPAGDIICHSLYPSGGYDITCTGLERHWAGNNVNGVCDAEKVCYSDYTCKLVNATLTDYDLPTGTFALSDTITTPYTINNTGEIKWTFLTEYTIRRADGSYILPKSWDELEKLEEMDNSFTHDIGCDIDHVGTWTTYLYVWTDEMVNGGWDVEPPTPSVDFTVVECLNDEDCETCFPGLGSTCDTTSNTCVLPECTPGEDIICHSLYPSGGFDITCTGLERHWSGNNVNGVCDDSEVCYDDYTCKFVNATLTDYDLPTGTFALSDTISIPYTTKNTGEITWSFLTESRIVDPGKDGIPGTGDENWLYTLPQFDTLVNGDLASGSLTYPIGCDNITGSWEASIYVYTDFVILGIGGWNVHPFEPYESFTVVECLNDDDCETCFPGLGYTCDTDSNKCSSPGSDEELVGTCMDVHDVTTFFVYCCGICGSLDFDWGDASCTGTGCVCSSGTQNTLFESYVYRVGGDGYGYLKGCISDSGSSRPIGGCVEVFDGGSTTRYYCHDAWGDGFCSGDTCACSTGTREHGYYSDVWNSVLLDRGMGYHKICMNTTPTATKIVGGCTEFRDIGTGIWDWCGRSWGSGSCSGTSCTCSRGIPTTWFGEAYAWDHIDSEETYSYSVVCVD